MNCYLKKQDKQWENKYKFHVCVVKEKNHKLIFKNNCLFLKKTCQIQKIQLSKCRRSDDELFNLVQFENIKNLKTEMFNNNIKTDMHLAFTKNTRKSITEALMNKWIKQKRLKPVELNALEYDQNSQDVKFVCWYARDC